MRPRIKRITLICPICKKSFERLLTDITGKISLCSKKCCQEYFKKFPGHNGRKIDITTRVSLTCNYCKKEFLRPMYEHKYRKFKHTFCSTECSKKYKEEMSIGLSEQRKRKVINQTKGCELCGSGFILEIHHKDGNSKNNKIENLQVLCKKCHYNIHGRNFQTYSPSLGIKKNHPAARLPSKNYIDDAGYDLYAVETKLIKPRGVTEVNIGISIAFPFEIYGIIYARSSFGKRGLQVHNGVIDNGFRGNITIFVYNHTDETYKVSKGDRIAQLLIFKNHSFYKPIELEELPTSERDQKGFGSSGI